MSDERNDRETTAREELEAARVRYQAAREADREARRAERDSERETARASRQSDRAERHRDRGPLHVGFGPELAAQIHDTLRDSFGGGPGSAFSDLGGGEEHAETVEKTFAVDGSPHFQLRNVSGESRIVAGPDGEVRVRARKRVRGTSEDRAKRLLENVEIRMEQTGNDISVRPHLYEQDRGWLDLFRGGRVAVDFDITVPEGSRVYVSTVSGDLDVRGTRGPLEVQSVSGAVTLVNVQGPTRLKTVSGDASCSELAGALEANSVSGDLTFDRCRLHGSDIVTVSGDVDVTGELDADREHRLKTISGDIDLALIGSSYDVRFKTMSGEFACDLAAQVSREGRRDMHVVVGDGATHVTVKTVSGDLQLRPGGGAVPEGSAASTTTVAADPEATLRMDPAGAGDAGAREILQRVARGELDVEAAARALDDARGARD